MGFAEELVDVIQYRELQSKVPGAKDILRRFEKPRPSFLGVSFHLVTIFVVDLFKHFLSVSGVMFQL